MKSFLEWFKGSTKVKRWMFLILIGLVLTCFGFSKVLTSEKLELVDLILIMTVEPGFGGQGYIESSTEKIREARKLFENAGIDMDIEVDGGIKLDNKRILVCTTEMNSDEDLTEYINAI